MGLVETLAASGKDGAPGRRSPARRRPVYLAAIVVVIAAGLASRRFRSSLPAFIGDYAGDTLWALMVFLGLALLLPKASTVRLAGVALLIAYLDELSQLYHAPWIRAIRRNWAGGLLLGDQFVWSDLLCYTAGVLMGAAAEVLVGHFRRR